MAKPKDKKEPAEKRQETVKNAEISAIMKESYIDYAMSVIVARALPDVRDGLKPAQRRILYTMLEDGLRHNVKYRNRRPWSVPLWAATIRTAILPFMTRWCVWPRTLPYAIR